MVVSWRSFGLFAVVVFVLRPICVFGGTIKSNLTLSEKLFISWISPRGIVTAAVASIFSINLIDNPVPFVDMKDAFMLLPLTFLIILGTVILQGLTAKPLARFLGVTRKEPRGIIFLSADKAARYFAHYIQKKGIPVLMADTSRQNSREAEAMGLEVHNRSLISEDVYEEIDFSQYGQLHAMTPNTEINLLTCKFLSEELGKERTYRVISKQETKHRSDAGTFSRNFLMMGRSELQEINRLVTKNPEFIERSFDDKKELENFLNAKKDSILPIFIFKNEKRILPVTERLPDIS
jgi:NhaP-type Na+/H+ or K+/H+ antiporter